MLSLLTNLDWPISFHHSLNNVTTAVKIFAGCMYRQMSLGFFSDGLHQRLEGKPSWATAPPQCFSAALFLRKTQPVCHALDYESNNDLMIFLFVVATLALV